MMSLILQYFSGRSSHIRVILLQGLQGVADLLNYFGLEHLKADINTVLKVTSICFDTKTFLYNIIEPR